MFPNKLISCITRNVPISWALWGCVCSCIRGSITHTSGHTLSGEILLNHSTRSIISSILKLFMLAGLDHALRSLFLISLDCLHPQHSPLSLAHRYLNISQGLLLTQFKAYVLIGFRNGSTDVESKVNPPRSCLLPQMSQNLLWVVRILSSMFSLRSQCQ